MHPPCAWCNALLLAGVHPSFLTLNHLEMNMIYDFHTPHLSIPVALLKIADLEELAEGETYLPRTFPE